MFTRIHIKYKSYLSKLVAPKIYLFSQSPTAYLKYKSSIPPRVKTILAACKDELIRFSLKNKKERSFLLLFQLRIQLYCVLS